MDYSGFGAEDFAGDETFTAWVRSGENELFWQKLMQSEPDTRPKIEEARAMVLAMLTLPSARLEPAEKKEMFQHISNEIAERDTEEVSGYRYMFFRKTWWAAASVLLVGSWLIWRLAITGHQDPVTYEKLVSAGIEEKALEEAVNAEKEPMLVNLPDGSSVLLLKGGRLSYHKKSFNQEKREVFLQGEAFFEVAKNPEKPFFVYANELVTKVLGTSFTIRAFEDAGNVEVVVKTGKVAVFTQKDPEKLQKMQDRKLKGLVLLPNEQIVLDRSGLKFSRSGIERPELLVLPAQKLSFEFDDVTFAEVAATIEKAYGVEIIFDKELLGKCRLTAYLSDEPLRDKIRMMCDALSARAEIADKKIYIKADACR